MMPSGVGMPAQHAMHLCVYCGDKRVGKTHDALDAVRLGTMAAADRMKRPVVRDV